MVFILLTQGEGAVFFRHTPALFRLVTHLKLQHAAIRDIAVTDKIARMGLTVQFRVPDIYVLLAISFRLDNELLAILHRDRGLPEFRAAQYVFIRSGTNTIDP